MSKGFAGIHAALITPYRTNGAVDLDELQRLVTHLTDQGMDGFFVGGSTAEAFLLSDGERREILEAVVAANQGRKKIICHIGSIGTQQAIALAKHAEKAGAHAIAAISPFYYHFSKQEILAYFNDIMNATPLPMFFYDYPRNTHFSLTEDVLSELALNPRLEGVKFTNFDVCLLERMKAGNPSLTILSGYDEILLTSLIMGADGGIGSTYNCMPGLISKIYDCYRAGDIQAARDYQHRANYVIQAICQYGTISSIKTLLSFQGFSDCGCRPPFGKISDEGRRALRAVYDRYIVE